jgi:hypothetical protein
MDRRQPRRSSGSTLWRRLLSVSPPLSSASPAQSSSFTCADAPINHTAAPTCRLAPRSSPTARLGAASATPESLPALPLESQWTRDSALFRLAEAIPDFMFASEAATAWTVELDDPPEIYAVDHIRGHARMGTSRVGLVSRNCAGRHTDLELHKVYEKDDARGGLSPPRRRQACEACPDLPTRRTLKTQCHDPPPSSCSFPATLTLAPRRPPA